MYRKIIIGYDGSESSEDALALGSALSKASEAQVSVVGVFPHGVSDDWQPHADFASRIEAAAKRIAAEAEAFASTSPARGLHDAAVELEADLIIVGRPSGSGVGQLPTGNVGVKLMHGSPSAVAVAHKALDGSPVDVGVIGVAINGSEESDHALSAAIEVGRVTGASLRLMSVAISPGTEFGWGYGVWDTDKQVDATFQEFLDKAAKGVPDGLETTTVLLHGDPVTAIAAECEKDVDLLFVGSRGYGPIRRVLLGSISAGLVAKAPCTVLAVPRGVKDADSSTSDTGGTATAH